MGPATICLALGLGVLAAVWLLVRSARRERRFVHLHPDFADWLRQLGLERPQQFLDLEAVIVSGHPGRRVVRLHLGEGEEMRLLYLKVEQTVRPIDRLRNALAGHGWVSRSLREARTLQRLHDRGMPAPRWLAVGEDAGRAFVLVEGIPEAVPLSRALQQRSAKERGELASALGSALARLHLAGFAHRDLYSKHVLVSDTGQIALLDWQRARESGRVSWSLRVRDLAALHATLPDSLASSRDRLVFLHSYCRATRLRAAPLVQAVLHESARLLRRRHIREKRQPHEAVQEWIRLDGQALCVTPALAEMYPDRGAWLGLDRQPVPPDEESARRWIELPTGGQALLVRKRTRAWLRSAEGQQREAMLLWRLQRHGIAAPRLLAVGKRKSGGHCETFLMVEPLQQTARLGAWIGRQPGARRVEILRRIGEMLARLHGGCCYLGDGGLRSLAVRSGDGDEFEPVLESTDGIAPLRRPSPRRAREDLAGLRKLLFDSNCSLEEWQFCESGYLTQGADLHQPSLWQRLRRGWWRYRQSADWPRFAGPNWLGRIMEWPVTDRFFAKQGRSTGRLVLEKPDGRLVVYLKRHYRLAPLSRLWSLLWPGGNWSPAAQEYNHLQWAGRQGVPVPRPVAFAEFIGPGLELQSVLVVEELTGMLPLNEAIAIAARNLRPNEFRDWKAGLARELARLVRLLHDRRHFHKDLYLCHFFIHEADTSRVPTDWREQVRVIDLHRLAKHRLVWWRWMIKDLAQLLYSSDLPGITARDRMIFWRAYRGEVRWNRLWRWLRLAIRLKWRRYERHNRKRQAQA